MLTFAVRTDHDSASAHIHPATHGEAALNRIAQWTPVGVVDQREQLADPMPRCIITICTNQGLRCEIHVIDVAVIVRRDDTL